jgi:hypothetical protein
LSEDCPEAQADTSPTIVAPADAGSASTASGKVRIGNSLCFIAPSVFKPANGDGYGLARKPDPLRPMFLTACTCFAAK